MRWLIQLYRNLSGLEITEQPKAGNTEVTCVAVARTVIAALPAAQSSHGNALNEPALADHVYHHHRQHRDYGGGHQEVPLHTVLALKRT